nr:immunoglobulin heavy chain junction region [Macaca mulatta]MOV87073.1 immunoglobulin heavy chain junction region [Macaca mulatta]MOV87165.1 immunoglobulin heavy chain junction region [Macaca mulatta]MOV87450.1 immunoglobulin heavy chain junction region [Macaca mulatta]MOV87519.1 immunoglobulin heavy chain junction region [Macaca mulatta]
CARFTSSYRNSLDVW